MISFKLAAGRSEPAGRLLVHGEIFKGTGAQTQDMGRKVARPTSSTDFLAALGYSWSWPPLPVEARNPKKLLANPSCEVNGGREYAVKSKETET